MRLVVVKGHVLHFAMELVLRPVVVVREVVWVVMVTVEVLVQAHARVLVQAHVQVRVKAIKRIVETL